MGPPSALSRSVHVGVRVRPASGDCAWAVDAEKGKIKEKSNRASKSRRCSSQSLSSFTFEHVFDQNADNEEVFQSMALEMIQEGIVQGYNATCFAYGQTASGKTHTMMGAKREPGTIPLAIHLLFDHMQHATSGHDFLVRVSYLEIYKEVISDLLNKNTSTRSHLAINEHPRKGAFVKGLTKYAVNSADEVIKLIARGERQRHVGRTDMNAVSSRSHTLLRLEIEHQARQKGRPSYETFSRPRAGSRHGVERAHPLAVAVKKHATRTECYSTELNFIDLAGSERISKTNATGERVEEAGFINTSLMTLGKIIELLSTKGFKGYLPLRDSKLTRLLSTALGGNSITSLICCVSPLRSNLEETKTTLLFASRAKLVVNKVRINRVAEIDSLLAKYKNEAMELRSQLETHQEEVATLQVTIAEKEGEFQQRQQRLEDQLSSQLKAHASFSEEVEQREKEFQGKLLKHAKTHRNLKAEIERAKGDAEMQEKRRDAEVRRLQEEQRKLIETVEREKEHERELELELEREREKEAQLEHRVRRMSAKEHNLEIRQAELIAQFERVRQEKETLESESQQKLEKLMREEHALESKLKLEVEHEHELMHELQAERAHERELEEQLRVAKDAEVRLGVVKKQLEVSNKSATELRKQLVEAQAAIDLARAERDEVMSNADLAVNRAKHSYNTEAKRATALTVQVRRLEVELEGARVAEQHAEARAGQLEDALVRQREAAREAARALSDRQTRELELELAAHEARAEAEMLQEQLEKSRAELTALLLKSPGSPAGKHRGLRCLSGASTASTMAGVGSDDEETAAVREVATLRAALAEREGFIAELEGRHTADRRRARLELELERDAHAETLARVAGLASNSHRMSYVVVDVLAFSRSAPLAK